PVGWRVTRGSSRSSDVADAPTTAHAVAWGVAVGRARSRLRLRIHGAVVGDPDAAPARHRQRDRAQGPVQADTLRGGCFRAGPAALLRQLHPALRDLAD